MSRWDQQGPRQGGWEQQGAYQQGGAYDSAGPYGRKFTERPGPNRGRPLQGQGRGMMGRGGGHGNYSDMGNYGQGFLDDPYDSYNGGGDGYNYHGQNQGKNF